MYPYLHSNFSSKLPLEVIDNAVINSLKLIDPSWERKLLNIQVDEVNKLEQYCSAVRRHCKKLGDQKIVKETIQEQQN